MNENCYEIDLKAIFLFFLRKYKKVMIVSLALALLFGTIKLSSIIIHNNNINVSKEVIAEYEKSINNYNNKISNLEEDIVNQQKNIDELSTYISESIIYNLDYNDVFVYEKYYFVDTNYYILPNMTYQNINYTNTVGNLYISFLNSAENKQKISESTSISENYLLELYTTKYSDSLISIKVYGANELFCETIMNTIDEVIIQIGNQINKNIVEHSLSVISISKCTCYSDFVKGAIDKADEKMLTYTSAIEKDNNNIIKYNEEKEKYIAEYNQQFEKQPFVVDSIIYGIIGLIIGIIIEFVYYALKYVMSDKVYNHVDVHISNEIEVVSKLNKRSKEDKICSYVSNKENRAINSDINDCCKLALSNIHSKGISPKSILVAGDVNNETIETITASFKTIDKSLSVFFGKDYINDVSCMEIFNKAEYILILIEVGISKKVFAMEEISKVKALNKNYGIIFIE